MKIIPLDILGLFNHVSANYFHLTDRIKTDRLSWRLQPFSINYVTSKVIFMLKQCETSLTPALTLDERLTFIVFFSTPAF